MFPLAGAHQLRRLVEDRGEVRVVGGRPGVAAALQSARGTAAELSADGREERLQTAEEGAAHCAARRGRGGVLLGVSVRVGGGKFCPCRGGF